ncbi:hypothetical protein [Streptomyces sp. B93]|uniref:hypothetical protein n=1 Tax=Streptomyces sp. B93 TaxID=2824875 RepID=UPI001B372092|nr:hypothetical protein [Streptomyces sp. B93]MBQ1094390.1 hypothetical protein [Streptomyces sp. B93]
MAGEQDRDRQGSPDSTGSGNSGQTASSTSVSSSDSYTTAPEVWSSLPDDPPSDRQIKETRRDKERVRLPANFDPESLRQLPERNPFYSTAIQGWAYVARGRTFTSALNRAGTAYRWVEANRNQIAAIGGGGTAAVLQGAGILGQDAAAPARTPGQAAYGAGTGVAAALGALSTVEGLRSVALELHRRYTGQGPSPEFKKSKWSNLGVWVTQAMQAGGAAAYGYGASGHQQDANSAYLTQGIGALSLGAGTLAQPLAEWYANRNNTQSTRQDTTQGTELSDLPSSDRRSTTSRHSRATAQDQPVAPVAPVGQWEQYDPRLWETATQDRPVAESSRMGQMRGAMENPVGSSSAFMSPNTGNGEQTRRSSQSTQSTQSSQSSSRHQHGQGSDRKGKGPAKKKGR